MKLYKFLRAIVRVLVKLLYKLRIHNRFPEPEGALIIASNHISMLDPAILASIFDREIRFIAKKELFTNKFLSWFFYKLGAFPVDRKGSDIKAIKTCLKIFKNEEVLGIFPEGTRVHSEDFSNMKNGIGLLATRGAKNIVTVRIESSYKLFSTIDVYFQEVIDVHKYDEIEEEKENKIAKDIFHSIYNRSINDQSK